MAIAGLLMLVWSGMCGATPSESEEEIARRLKSLSLEVTSVSKKPEKLSDAPAAAYVITNEDIRRSGATSIPEALRLAPGVQVARIHSNGWIITSRGFAGYAANKLLVMIDGRTVYSPLYSGVYWSHQDVLLEDVDRIEVIRGPGAALWGANAVNGVINVITKSAADTKGSLVAAGAGTYERGFAGIRHGARVAGADVRAYVKYFDRGAGADPPVHDANDDWRVIRGGFRADVRLSDRDSLTVQGDAYAGSAGTTYAFPSVSAPYKDMVRENTELDGCNLLARWTHALANSNSGEFALQMYYDHTGNEDSLIHEARDTLDVDFQHGFAIGRRHDLLWGVQYRWTSDRLEDQPSVDFDPSERTMDLFSLFLQDQITLMENRLWVILGVKLENSYNTGWEAQPTGRLLWKPLKAHTFWAAVSRAVRTPSRAERDGRLDVEATPPGAAGIPSPFPVMLQFMGDNDFSSEELIAYELGWRFQPWERFFCDLSTFYNEYPHFFSRQDSAPVFAPGPPPHLVLPVTFANEREVQTRGVELAVNLAPLDWTRFQLVYSYLHVDEDSEILDVEGYSPEHQISLLSSMDLPYSLELDLWARWIDDLSSLDIDGYGALDVRLSWSPSEKLEISLVGRNLLDGRHPEYRDILSALTPTELERSVYGKATWRF